MVKIGQFNRLCIVKQVDFGVYVDGEDLGTILVPKRYVPANSKIGDWLEVFIYFDSDDCLIATTQTPTIEVGQCAYLKVKQVNSVGAFLDWGLLKDLLVPYSEQHKPFEEGRSYVVTAYRDQYSDRILASSKLNRHLPETADHFQPNEKVDLLVFGKTDMGYKAVINHTHIGLIFRDEAFKPLSYGQQLAGYVKALRADGKIDLSLQLPAGLARPGLTQEIIAYMEQRGGVSLLTDKSPPEAIYEAFNVSKANYKKALGALLKQQKIVMLPDKIQLK